jgi:tRNA 2-thiocytidine biosynthesis protein TtcA
MHGQKLTKQERRIVKRAAKLIERFNLIEANDRIMVCISGGKDSYAMLEVLQVLQRKSPIPFSLIAVHLNQGWKLEEHFHIQGWLKDNGVEYRMEVRDHAAVVEEKLTGSRVPCALCSRLRRGALYGIAEKLQCNKLALGHHLDDAADSLLLNLFHNGRLASLPPLLQAKNGIHQVIRPLLAVPESEIKEMAAARGYPVVRCGCPFVCAATGERLRVRGIIDELEREHPRIRDSIRRALSNVQGKYLWVDTP